MALPKSDMFNNGEKRNRAGHCGHVPDPETAPAAPLPGNSMLDRVAHCPQIFVRRLSDGLQQRVPNLFPMAIFAWVHALLPALARMKLFIFARPVEICERTVVSDDPKIRATSALE
jgi:hypothetical protein